MEKTICCQCGYDFDWDSVTCENCEKNFCDDLCFMEHMEEVANHSGEM